MCDATWCKIAIAKALIERKAKCRFTLQLQRRQLNTSTYSYCSCNNFNWFILVAFASQVIESHGKNNTNRRKGQQAILKIDQAKSRFEFGKKKQNKTTTRALDLSNLVERFLTGLAGHSIIESYSYAPTSQRSEIEQLKVTMKLT